MALAPGYRYVPGTHNRSVRTPSGDIITRRQGENIAAQLAGHTTLSAQRRAGGLASSLKGGEKEYRDSWRKNAKEQGLDTRIRGNANYTFFRQELRDIERNKQHLIDTLGKRDGRIAYRDQRLDTYLKFGLITKEQYDKYKGV